MMLPLLGHGPLILQDLWGPQRFQEARADLLPLILALKKKRRVMVGPHATVLFESKVLVWWQIQEMLRTEPQADPQEELEAYNPLVPTADQLCMTLFLEYTDAFERQSALKRLVGIEKRVYFSLGKQRVQAVAEGPSGATACAVNFLILPLAPSQRNLFGADFLPSTLSIEHPQYTYSAPIERALWEELAKDLQLAGEQS